MTKRCFVILSIKVLVMLVAMSSFEVSAQELKVYYDCHTKEVVYKVKDEVVYKPRIKKGEQIVLHLQNYNNFLYTAELQVDEEVMKVPSGGDHSNQLLSGIAKGTGSFMGLSSIFPDAGISLNQTKDISFSGYGFGANAEEMQQLQQIKSSFDAAIRDMHSAEKQLNFIKEDINTYYEGKVVNKVIVEELIKMRKNPRLQPAQIKSLSIEYLQKIFGTKNLDDITLSTLIEKSDGKTELRGYQQKLETEAEKYIQSRDIISGIANDLKHINLSDIDVNTLKNSTKNVIEKSQRTEQTIRENKERLTNFLQEATEEDIRNLAALRYEYEAISSNDFSESFRINAEGDQTIIRLKLIPKDSTGIGVPKNTVELPALKIPVVGGLKLNTSIGISFGKFMNQPLTYFVKDSTIAGQENDMFTPILTSFLHFYGQPRGELTLGGSLGVGLPISGELNQQSLNFFIGPSLIIGKGERIVINAGILGSKVQKLARGLELGSPFNNELGEVPTYLRYELGYFLGFSFNLIKQ